MPSAPSQRAFCTYFGRLRGLTQCHTFYIKRILVSHVDGGTQRMLIRFESLLSY